MRIKCSFVHAEKEVLGTRLASDSPSREEMSSAIDVKTLDAQMATHMHACRADEIKGKAQIMICL